jgi:hypothetical protein
MACPQALVVWVTSTQDEAEFPSQGRVLFNPPIAIIARGDEVVRVEQAPPGAPLAEFV